MALLTGTNFAGGRAGMLRNLLFWHLAQKSSNHRPPPGGPIAHPLQEPYFTKVALFPSVPSFAGKDIAVGCGDACEQFIKKLKFIEGCWILGHKHNCWLRKGITPQQQLGLLGMEKQRCHGNTDFSLTQYSTVRFPLINQAEMEVPGHCSPAFQVFTYTEHLFSFPWGEQPLSTTIGAIFTQQRRLFQCQLMSCSLPELMEWDTYSVQLLKILVECWTYRDSQMSQIST